MANQRVTSIDVARLAGVSQSTVSRTFTPGASVSPDARERVLAAAAALGYTPNALARSLITRQSNIIGIVMADLTSPFSPHVLEKFLQRLQAIGRQVLIFDTAPDEKIDYLLDQVLQYRIDGLIITSATISSHMADQCTSNGIPVVLFNRYELGAKVSAVCCDNVEGGRLVANLLLDAGHRRLAFVAGREDSSTSIDREKGFGDRLRERGVAHWQRESAGAYWYEAGYEVACRLLSGADRPDAIFCASDSLAFGVMDAARNRCQVAIPEELSIIGFDDIPAAAWASYALTTVRTPVRRMIDATLKLLLDQLEGQPVAEPAVNLIPGELIQRTSARLATASPTNDGTSALLTPHPLGESE
jgi:DNA-binding LacI/PurR family transcriptional regulator